MDVLSVCLTLGILYKFSCDVENLLICASLAVVCMDGQHFHGGHHRQLLGVSVCQALADILIIVLCLHCVTGWYVGTVSMHRVTPASESFPILLV